MLRNRERLIARTRAAIVSGLLAVGASLAIIGCAQRTDDAAGADAASPAAVAQAGVPAGDIIRSAGVTLGANWFPLETFGGQTFRWVNNYAEIDVTKSSLGAALYLDVEPGPSVVAMPMKLRFVSGSSTVDFSVSHRAVVRIVPTATTTSMRVLNGGKPVAGDSRLLNVRVFSIGTTKPAAEAARDGDIVDANIRIGANWGVLEHYEGKTFRWIDNDATFSVAPAHKRVLVLTVQAGPGLGATPLRLSVFTGAQTLVAKGSPAGSGPATISVPLPNGTTVFRLHVDGGGAKIASDPRILNFRVLDAHVLEN